MKYYQVCFMNSTLIELVYGNQTILKILNGTKWI